MSAERISIKRANFPEEVGVSSFALAEFIDDLDKNNIEMHSIMVIRHGKVAFETWREPYAPDIPHTMYSISKSVTSTAIGFAIEEGLLTLETKVADIFPEFRPAKSDELLEKLTVYHLLTMTAGKDIGLASDKAKNNWFEEFFNAKWVFAPGESWRYISENTYMLSAILNRVTGMPMTDYLMPRLFEPLGIKRKPFWEKSAEGMEAGGWGLFLTTEECAKFILCYQQGGVFEGKQVIPANWAREAVKNLVDNRRPRDVEKDTVAGYGYCFWRNGYPDSYRADGMFSQFAMVFEKLDAILVVTSCEMDEDKTRHCIWRHFPGVFVEVGDKPFSDPAIKEKLRFKPLPELPAAARSSMEKDIAGKTMRIRRQKLLNLAGFPVSMIPLPVLYMGTDKAGNIDRVRFMFSENECSMSWNEGDVRNTIVCGMDGQARQSKIRLAGFELTANSTAAWEDENTLSVWMRPLEAICQRRIKFVFSAGKVSFKPSCVPDSSCMLDYVSGRIKIYVKNPVISKLGETAVNKSIKIVEPVHRGTISG
jgi:CubicO group peptidase (beta-lactamase class C family)